LLPCAVRQGAKPAPDSSAQRRILALGSDVAITAEVNKVLADHNITAGDANLKIMVNDKVADAGTAVQNDKISVAVSIPIAKVCWIPPTFLSSGSVESETVVMMRQR